MTHTAPKVTRDDVSFVLTNPTATVVLDYNRDGAVYPHTSAAVDPFTAPHLLVLVTVDDVRHAMGEANGNVGRATRILNLDLYALFSRGEIPTREELEATLAEVTAYEAEVIDLVARRGGAA